MKLHVLPRPARTLLLGVCLALIPGMRTGYAQAQEAAAVSSSAAGHWAGDGEDWQYILPDGEPLERSWLHDNGLWYYFGSDGYMKIGKHKIGSHTYFFREDGAMAVGWAYDYEEDVWYHAGDDGRLTKGWLLAGDAWYWFNSSCEMYHGGERMVSGHKYYFFENGQMAADQYVGTGYYDENGLRDRRYDMTIQGKRRPDKDEQERITKALAEAPREWIRAFHESGWEMMFYTDKKYFSAPRTEQGIFYVYHKTDTHYRKLKFTNPDTLAMAFGEYVAWATGNDGDANGFMADYGQYLARSSIAQPLPSYFDGNISMQFGRLFESFCSEELRADMRRNSPDLLRYLEQTLKITREGRKPDLDELEYGDFLDEWGAGSEIRGPAGDESLVEKQGPGE